MISTVHRGQILISDKQIRKQKCLVCIPSQCNGNTTLILSAAFAGVHCPGKKIGSFQPNEGSQAGEGGNRLPCSSYVKPLLAVFSLTLQTHGTGCQQVMLHLPWAVASSRSAAGAAAIFPGTQCWHRACCSVLLPAPWSWWWSPEKWGWGLPTALWGSQKQCCTPTRHQANSHSCTRTWPQCSKQALHSDTFLCLLTSKKEQWHAHLGT